MVGATCGPELLKVENGGNEIVGFRDPTDPTDPTYAVTAPGADSFG
jgi:hypothetical protein